MKLEIDAITKALFGEQSRHVAFNYILQRGDRHEPDKAAVIGNTVHARNMSFEVDPRFAHVLVLCDAIIRPHLVIGSNHARGHGAAGLLTSSDGIGGVDAWLRHGTIIIDNIKREEAE